MPNPGGAPVRQDSLPQILRDNDRRISDLERALAASISGIGIGSGTSVQIGGDIGGTPSSPTVIGLHYQVTGNDIQASTITADNIKAGTITANEIFAGTITAHEIKAGTITANEIKAGTITANEIQAATITANEIHAGTITSDRLYAGFVQANLIQAANIAAGTITADRLYAGTIQANLIQAANIAAGTITANEIAANTITAGQIQAGSITANEIAASTITAANIAANTITASQIAATTITAANIAANTITTNQIAANTITAANIAAGTITTNEIAANTITASDIAANTITAGQIQAGSITTTEIAANTITAGNIAAATITSNEIKAGTIDTVNIKANAITTSLLAANAVTSDVIAVGSITGTSISAATIDASKMNIVTLSSLTANMGNLTAGTITGATIQTAASGARVVMNSGGLTAYNASNAAVLNFDPSTGTLSLTGAVNANSSSVIPTTTLNPGSVGITSTQIGQNNVTGGVAGNLAIGTITTDNIFANTITAGDIAANTITGNEIQAASVNADRLIAHTVTAGQIQAGTITSTEIHAGTITSDKLYSGSVQANLIQAANIAAGTITTDRLVAGTTAINMVQNFSFESFDASNIPLNWAAVENAGTFISSTDDKTDGSYSLKIGDGVGSNFGVGTRAIPVTPGRTYLVRAKVRHSNGTGTWYFRIQNSTASATAPPANGYIGSMAGQQVRDGLTDLVSGQSCAAIQGGVGAWVTSGAYTYTVPAGVNWINVTFYNYSSSTGYLYVDEVEFRPASNITYIENGIITTDKIQANAITATQIAANTITTAQIQAGAVNADRIAAGTITATQIQVSSIDASRLNVTNLSAITANLGTITSGTITGGVIQTSIASINAVRFDGSGIRAYDGAGTQTFNLTNTGVLTLAPGTVTGSEISTSAGTRITGNNIETGAITADKITMRIGGQNVVPNSNFVTWSGNSPINFGQYDNGGNTSPTWSRIASGGPTGTEDSWRYTVGTKTTGGGFQTNQIIHFKANTNYVFSWWMKGNQGPNGMPSNFSSTLTYTWIENPAPSTTLWQRYSVRMNNSSAVTDGLYWNFASNADVQIAKVQFEEGDFPTNWKQYIDPTVIDGGSITSATIQNQINNPKVILDGSGLRYLDGSGNSTVNLSSSTNGLQLLTAPYPSSIWGLDTGNRERSVDWYNSAVGTVLGQIVTYDGTAFNQGTFQTFSRSDLSNYAAWTTLRAVYGFGASGTSFWGATVDMTSGGSTTNTYTESFLNLGTTSIRKTMLRGDGASDYAQLGSIAKFKIWGPYDLGFTGNLASGVEIATATITHSAGVTPIMAAGMLYDGSWSHQCQWRKGATWNSSQCNFQIRNPGPNTANAGLVVILITTS